MSREADKLRQANLRPFGKFGAGVRVRRVGHSARAAYLLGPRPARLATSQARRPGGGGVRRVVIMSESDALRQPISAPSP